MKKLKLQNQSYRLFVANYKEWLDILGYAESTVYYLPNHLQEFFYYAEQNHIKTLTEITPKIIKEYYRELKERANERTSGSLSKSYLNKHQQALKKFKEYLQNHNYKGFNLHLKSERNPTEEKLNILTQSEIKELFSATSQSHHSQRIQLRDKAMLVVLYSCGLRRNEAVHLDTSDIFFDKERILVRKGKNYKERYVPINHYNLELLESYIYDARIQFKNYNTSEALLIGQSGNRMNGSAIARHLKSIIEVTNNEVLQSKNITPHKLRHAIATHFLQAGMDIEYIKQFLGHAHLELSLIHI